MKLGSICAQLRNGRMESAIRAGELRLLVSETPYDVILSCNGRKLTAHKLILSIASPILQDLLLQDIADTTVLIFPDVDGNVMSLVLDYIYNGSVTVPAYNLPEFLGIAALLKLHLDHDYLEQDKPKTKVDISESIIKGLDSTTPIALLEKLQPPSYLQKYTNKLPDAEEHEGVVNKQLRKVPNLMPISSLQRGGVAARRGLYNRVFPSPWCPRVVPLLADPREDCSAGNEQSIIAHSVKEKLIEENDTNNNFQIRTQQPYLPPTVLRNCPPKATFLIQPENLVPHHRTNSTFPTNLRSPANSLSSSPVHAETEEKSAVYQHEVEKCSDGEGVHGPKASFKEEAKENALSVKSPRTPETDDEALKKEHKADKNKPFKCNDCGKSFSQLRNYKYHRSIHEGTREFAARCPECGKIFNDRGYLSSHLKIHRDRKEYACPNCPKRFNQRVAYNMHLRIHTGVKPHECPTCGKTFSRKMLLKQHQRVHTGERPYSCPECGKSFADRSNMSLHARLHTGVKPYACNLCPKSFTKKHHLKTHMNFHTGLKPYSCQKCGLSFSQSSNMRTHYKKCILKSPPTPPTTQSS